MIIDFKYLFLGVLTICMSSLEKYLFRPSGHFFLLCFLYWVVWVIYFGYYPLMVIFAKYFISFNRLSFHFVSGFLCFAEVFKFICSFLLLCRLPEETYPKIYHYNLCQSVVLPMFSSRSFMVWGLWSIWG